MKYGILCLLAALASPATLSQQQGGNHDLATATPEATLPPDTTAPLFESHELLQLTLEAPLSDVIMERSQESSEYPGTLSYENASGERVALDVEVKTRGKKRLDRNTCDFPPLRLDVEQNKVANTLFANQDKIKLVTHCQGRRAYEQYVLLEYLAYRVYNLLTDFSFKVRMAQITYVDTKQPDDSLTKYAFLIENEDRMAARLGWEVLQFPQLHPDYMEEVELSLLEVFQFMIGNTDWDAFFPEPDKEDCCHNTVPIGSMAVVYSVPYDFDYAGIIATPYAVPSERLPIRTVRERLYRGVCRPDEELARTLAVFNQQKEAIYALYRNEPLLEDSYRERTIEYLDDFYEIIEDPGKVRREMISKCRGV
jgi:hypothetical protein